MKKDYVGELSEYFRKNMGKGYNLESLKWALVNQGHSKIEVEKALKKVQDEQAAKKPIIEQIKEQPVQQPAVEVLPEKQSFWKKLFG